MSITCPVLTVDCLKLNCAAAVGEITRAIRNALTRFHRRGVIIALSGGIDSSVTAALCVRAVGTSRVFGVHIQNGIPLPKRWLSASAFLTISDCIPSWRISRLY